VQISRAIQAYHGEADEHHRYRSWEHCYRYFRQLTEQDLVTNREHAALQLAFYLASWGMYRGSSFLLQHAYTVHRSVIDVLVSPRFEALKDPNFGTRAADLHLVPLVSDLVAAVKAAYFPFARRVGAGNTTDTLVTKVILGTIGCLPACDRYFIDGFKSQGLPYSNLNQKSISQIIDFSQTNAAELLSQQSSLQETCGLQYPVMKLVDMYFWQLGYERDPKAGKRRRAAPT
jgi:hypothetical protein